jgi:hypothetical protein
MRGTCRASRGLHLAFGILHLRCMYCMYCTVLYYATHISRMHMEMDMRH